jgi:hypothetical protein
MAPPDRPPIRDLVVRAFLMARQSAKKPDWTRMTTAVLKNRLLTLTHGDFSEQHYGVASLAELLEPFRGDLLTIDTSVRPVVVEIRTERLYAERGTPIQEFLPGVSTEISQVRADLWRAVLDYSSGRQYVWDPVEQRARAAGDNTVALPILPTVARKDFAGWRVEFVALHDAELDEKERAATIKWRDAGLATRLLPRKLQPLWNAELRSRVVERVKSWFGEQRLELPIDLTSAARQPDEKADVEALRSLIIDCVRVMTGRELRELRLPPAAVLRLRRPDRG